MSRDYSLGYAAGSRHSWPKHRPPEPPNEIVAILMVAARKLRDEADSFCATIGNDDEVARGLREGIDGLDEALIGVSDWLLKVERMPKP